MPKTKGNPKSVATTEPHPLISIAIAERDGIFRAGLSSLLSETGKYKILMQAESEAELFSLFEKSKNLPLILIIDINTLSNNYEGIRKLKYDYHKVKILVLIDTFSLYTILNLLRCEVNGILLKSSPAKELEKSLFDIHTKGYYYTKQITKELFDGVRYKEIREPDITKKQLKFMELISSNLSYNEIAQRLDVGVRTIDGYRDLLFEKFNLQNRTDLVLFALKTGLIKLEDTISTDAEIIRYREPDSQ
jgi:DNA-binding NarL/FixJ family response regulator